MIHINIKLFKYNELDRKVQDAIYERKKHEFIIKEEIDDLFEHFVQKNGQISKYIVNPDGTLSNHGGFVFFIHEAVITAGVLKELKKKFGKQAASGEYTAVPVFKDGLKDPIWFKVMSCDENYKKELACSYLEKLLFRIYDEWKEMLNKYIEKKTDRESFDYQMTFGPISAWFHEDGIAATDEEENLAFAIRRNKYSTSVPCQ